jgi:hypothetical protein
MTAAKSTATSKDKVKVRQNQGERRKAWGVARGVTASVGSEGRVDVALGVAVAAAFTVRVAVGKDVRVGRSMFVGVAVRVDTSAFVGMEVWVAVELACSLTRVGLALGVDTRVWTVDWVAVGCVVEVRVLVGAAEVAVRGLLGMANVGVTGPGVGERVGTVWRAGSWNGVAQATPESEAARTMLDSSKTSSP